MDKRKLKTPTISNDITINPDKIRKCLNNSITNPETIRQIALYAIKNNDNSLNCKIKKEFEVFGLYPHIIKKLDIKPDISM